jgi:EmrB/QacA subfamily drug resistance transporter
MWAMETTLTAPLMIARRERPDRSERRAWLGFGVVLAAAVMDLLDSTITNTAAPAIRRDLGGSYADLEWIAASYTLAMAVMLLVGGRLGDLLGRRRVLLGGILGFTVASLLCALAPNPPLLIAARALQGGVGAIMLPQGFAMIRALFGAENMQKPFAVFGPVMGLSAVAGPIVGGALIDANIAGSAWRMIFLVNLPIGLTAWWVGRRLLPRDEPVERGRLDLVSAGLGGAGAFLLVYPLVQGRELGWPTWIVAMLIAAVPVLAGFGALQVRRARAGATPLVAPSLFALRAYASGLAFIVCFVGAMGGVVLTLNVMLQTGLGFSPLHAGVATITLPFGAIVGTIAASVLVGRLGRVVLQIGTAVMAAGLALLALVLHGSGAGTDGMDVAPALLLAGAGMGMIFMPMFDTILAGVPDRELGSASGLMQAVQQLGMSLGIAVIGTLYFDRVGASHARGTFVAAGEHTLLISAGFLAAAFVVVFALPRRPRPSTH